MTVPALSVRGMSKRFGAVEALDEVGLEIRRGDVHGLVGANGSGKSTLVKVLAGYHVPDSGNMHAWGRPVALPVADAGRHGIAVIHQDLGLIDELSVTENVIGTTGFGTAPWLPIRWDGQRERVAALLRRLGIDIDPRTEVGDLSRGERTLVAVARAVSELEGAAQERLLVTDEPTAALSSSEAGAVWGLLRRVTSEGGAALFISHHLQEVRLRCDCVTVLRDGRVVLTAACADVTEADLVTAMLGTSGVNMTAPQLPDVPAPSIAQDALLEVQSLTDARLSDVTFAAHAGEVIGVTGLLGMGQERIPALLSGAARRASGDVRVAGRSLPPGDDRAAAGAGLVTVPAERQRDGLWMDGSVAENLGIVRAGAFFVRGRYDRNRERVRAADLVERFGVQPPDVTTHVGDLSGGNQQKVLLAKWLQLEPRVVVLHEPTQGVDVAAKLQIHRIVREFVDRTGGTACIVSSDHEEVADHCERVVIMDHGKVRATLEGDEVSVRSILTTASAA